MPVTQRQLKPWQRSILYSAFAFVSLIAMVLLTFPYSRLKELLRQQASAAGYLLKVDSLGPGFFAVRASGLQLAKEAEGDKPVEWLRIDTVSVGPTLFPPGLGLKASALGGTVVAKTAGFSGSRLQFEASGVDLSQGNLKGFSGVDLSGQVSAAVDLAVPVVASGGKSEQDFSQASGTVTMESKGLSINGGEVTVTLAQFGNQPMKQGLPKFALGDIVGALKFEKGLGTIERFESKSSDIESQISGTLKLARRVEYSEPNMEIRFKPDAEAQKRLGVFGMAFSMVGADPKDSTWRKGKLTGYLGQPKFP